MHKLYLLAGLLFVSLASSAQDTAWKITKVNKDMSFSLPSNQEKIDTSAIRTSVQVDLSIFKATTENTLFVLTVTRKGAEINVTDPESLKDSYNEIEDGIKKSKNLAVYKTISTDTVIDKIPARKMIFYTGTDSLGSRLKGYFFLINDHLYFLLVYKMGTDEIYKAESNRLLRSIHFTATEISERQFNSKLESRGYKIGTVIGRLLGGFVVIAVIILIIVLVTRKSSRKEDF